MQTAGSVVVSFVCSSIIVPLQPLGCDMEAPLLIAQGSSTAAAAATDAVDPAEEASAQVDALAVEVAASKDSLRRLVRYMRFTSGLVRGAHS